MRFFCALIFSFSLAGAASAQDAAEAPTGTQTVSTFTPFMVAQSYSCTPRKTCSKTIRSCKEARWLYANCSWGGKLDRDNDGIPCENLC